MTSSEVDNTFTALTGWSGKATNAGRLFWGIIGAIFSCIACWALYDLLTTLLYVTSVIPGVNVAPHVEETYGHVAPKASSAVSWAFDATGHTIFILHGTVGMMGFGGILMLIISISIPTYLMFRYWNQDSRTPNHGHY